MTTQINDDKVILVGDGYTDLYKILFNNASVAYVKNDNTVTWQGNIYEGITLAIAGLDQNTQGELTRPILTLVNTYQGIDGFFSNAVNSRIIERGIITRYRVLYDNLINNVNLFVQESWRMSQVKSLNRTQVVIELRADHDGPAHLIPARKYRTPEFPNVSIK